MKIDFSKIPQATIDKMIMEEAIKLRNEFLAKRNTEDDVKKLMEEKKSIQEMLAALDEPMEEGPLDKLRGTVVGKAMGMKSAEDKQKEKMAKAQELIMAHPAKRAAYQSLLSKDAAKAQKYLEYWAENPSAKSIKWDEENQKYMDPAILPGNAFNAFTESDQPIS